MKIDYSTGCSQGSANFPYLETDLSSLRYPFLFL